MLQGIGTVEGIDTTMKLGTVSHQRQLDLRHITDLAHINMLRNAHNA